MAKVPENRPVRLAELDAHRLADVVEALRRVDRDDPVRVPDDDLASVRTAREQVEAQAAGVWAPDHHDLYLWQAVQRLRSEGVRVVQALPGQDVSAASEAGCDRLLQVCDGRWQLAPLAP